MLVRKEDTVQFQMMKSVILKCRKDKIEGTLRKWGRLSEETLSSLKGKTKASILQILSDALEDDQEMTDEILGDLELSYMQLHSQIKLWQVYRLSGIEMKLSLDPRVLRSQLLTAVQLKWKRGRVLGNMSFFSGALWIRIHLSTSTIRKKAEHYVYHPTHSVFIVAFPGSPFIIMSKTGMPIFKVVSEAVVQVLKAERFHDIKLSGRHVASLADIALKKNSQANIHSYSEKDESDDCQGPGQKRKLSDDLEDRDYIVDENRQEKRRRRMDIDSKFGPEPQPILETLEYNFDLPCKGKAAVAMTDTRCGSSVRLKGPSVLEGLRQMARRGFLKFPLPQHVYGASSSQRNHFNVVSRKDRQT